MHKNDDEYRSKEWITLNDVQYSKHEFFRMGNVFKGAELNHSMVAFARFGGPIALTRNPDDIVFGDNQLRESVGVFNNNGTLLKTIPIKEAMEAGIACFEFIEDEILLILMRNGCYLLIDLYTGSTKKITLRKQQFEQEKIAKGKVCKNSLIFLTSKNIFYYVADVHSPYLEPLAVTSQVTQLSISNFLVIPPSHSLSTDIEVHVPQADSGIYLVGLSDVKSFYGRQSAGKIGGVASDLPEISKIIMCAASANYKLISYYTENDEVYVVSIDFNPKTWFLLQVGDTSGQGKKPKAMVWCGDDCIVLVHSKHIVLLGPKKAQKRIEYDAKGILTFPETDGLRIVTSKKNEFLRRIPECYSNVLKLLSHQPGATLFDAYKAYEAREPLPDEDIRSKKDDLLSAVNDCLDAATFELNERLQQTLLKAAAYGKLFLPQGVFDHNRFAEACKYIKVLHNVNHEYIQRTMTYQQLKSIDEEHLIKILMRYRLHFLAFTIINLLRPLDQDKHLRSIYTNWACCKVQESNDPPEMICLAIKEKTKDQQGISYTEIAHRAVEAGKKDLAKLLMELENSYHKRVPVFLWMQEWDLALRNAIASNDTNLLNLVIHSIVKADMREADMYQMLSFHELSRSHLMSYYNLFEEAKLNAYLKYLKNPEESAFTAVAQAYTTTRVDTRLQCLNFAAKFFAESGNKFYSDMVSEHLEVLKKIKTSMDSADPKKGKVQMEDKPIQKVLEFVMEDDIKVAQSLQKTCKIPEPRFAFTRMKDLAKRGKWDEFDKYVNEKNRGSSIIVPFDFIIDLCLENKQEELAERYALRIPDIGEGVSYLKYMGKYRMAVDHAFKNKNMEIVQEIKDLMHAQNNFEIQNYIESLLMKNKK